MAHDGGRRPQPRASAAPSQPAAARPLAHGKRLFWGAFRRLFVSFLGPFLGPFSDVNWALIGPIWALLGLLAGDLAGELEMWSRRPCMIFPRPRSI